MNVSANWIRELAPGLEGGAAEMASRFSMTAAAVEGMETIGGGLEDIVVARVLETKPHPNADRLTLCVVDAGMADPVDVVCGAPVIEPGATYPYVPVGATLPAGFTIEARKIRGETSYGMLCSEIELQLGRDRSGIMRLPDGLQPGTSILEALGLPDVRFALDLNPNRVDLACHFGVARELKDAASELAPREVGGPGWSAAWADGESVAEAGGVTVRIESPDRCARYLGAVIRGVKVGPSPAWLVGRLLAVGARPINNVVDATNYVLLERNQPLHAFDLATLAGSEVRVRAAEAGETLVTLDGESRRLRPEATVIADRDRAIALAGVMGGENTEVCGETVDLLIECADFDPLSVRKTARSVGLSTDASYRFERGIDHHAQEEALARCVELILAIAGGEADERGLRVGARPPEPPDLTLRRSRVAQVLGIDLETDRLAELLEPIGFRCTAEPDADATSDTIAVSVPGWRGDVTREIDLVEEVARRFGYDDFPDEDRRFRPSAVPEHRGFERAERVRRLLAARGFLEARSVSFMPEVHRGNRSTVAVPNPLSAEESFLRGAMVPVLLRRLEHNYARGRRHVRLFEVGTVFRMADGPSPGDSRNDGLQAYAEESRLAFVMAGAAVPPHWSAEAPDLDLWDLKGVASEVAAELCEGEVEPLEPGADARADELGGAWIGSDAFRLVRDGRTIGVAGAVRAESIDAPPWAASVWALELELEAVRARGVTAYRPLSQYPAVRRDLAIVVPASAAAAAIEEAIREAASDLLESVRLFDVYEGGEVESGRRSLGWGFRFRANDRTLTDEEVEGEMTSIAAALEDRFDARIRTS